MSIKNRLLDAKALINQGRHEGALLSLLVAVAATSRKRYPHRPQRKSKGTKKAKKTKVGPPVMGDREAFTAFVRESMKIIANCENYFVTFRSASVRLEDVLYEHLRCELAHAAKLPNDVAFVVGKPGALSVKVEPSRITFSTGLLDSLYRAVVLAKENAVDLAQVAPAGTLEV